MDAKRIAELIEFHKQDAAKWYGGEFGKSIARDTADALEALQSRLNRTTTHSEDCWKWHHGCALTKLEALQAENAALSDALKAANDDAVKLRQLVRGEIYFEPLPIKHVCRWPHDDMGRDV